MEEPTIEEVKKAKSTAEGEIRDALRKLSKSLPRHSSIEINLDLLQTRTMDGSVDLGSTIVEIKVFV